MQFTKIQFTLLLLLLLSISILIVPSTDAQTVHALLIIMDADSRIGPAMKIDQREIEELLASVNRVYSLKKTVYLSSNNATRRSAVLDWIQNVRPARDDVMFVYYGGHGTMVSHIYKETYLQLTDRELFRSKLANTMQQANSCRLKLLITDACSSAPSPAIPMSYAVETVSKRHIKDLFGQHEGFLHVNAATEGEYAWCNNADGSNFTLSLIDSISDQSDTDRDGFVTWKEVFKLAIKGTKERYDQIYPNFSDRRKFNLQLQGIISQTPKAYSLPERMESRLPERPRDPADSLWELRNPRRGFNVELQTDKSKYRIGDYLTLRMTGEEGCYITVLNWDQKGKLTVLFPNQYESNNFVRSGKIHTFPTPQDGFDFILPGPIGRERFKLIAVRSRAANQALKTVLGSVPQENSSPYRVQAEIVPRDKTETRILKELLKLRPADWTESSTTIILR